MKYPAVERLKFSEITAPTYGVVIDDKGAQKPMSGIRLVSHQRERDRASPRLLVRALENPQSIAAMPDQKLGDRSLPAVSVKAGINTYIVLFDPRDQASGGDPHPRRRCRLRRFELRHDPVGLEGRRRWLEAGAHAVRSGSTAWRSQRLTLKEISINAAIAADTFAVNDSLKAGGKRRGCNRRALSVGAAADVPRPLPRQRQGLLSGRTAASSSSSWRRTCSTFRAAAANNLIVAMKDGLVIFDAPVDEGQSRWVIDAAKAKYPGKPVKQLVHDPSSHGSHRRHPDLCGGRRGDRDPGPGPAVLREDAAGRAQADAGRAREAAEAGEDRGREGHDDAQGRHDRDQAAQHPEPACRRHDHRRTWSGRTSCTSRT